MARNKGCALCGRDDVPLTLEHIYGEWIQAAMPPLGQRIRSLTRFDPNGGAAISETDWAEDQGFTNRQVRILCDDCNSLWGGRLEGKTKEPGLALVRGQPRTLDLIDISWLSVWATKVSYLSEFADGDSHPSAISADQRRRLVEHTRPPDGTWVWLFGVNMSDPNLRPFHRHRTFTLEVLDGVAVRADPDSYLTTLYIGQLGLFVLGVGMQELAQVSIVRTDVAAATGGAIVPIWPHPDAEIRTPLPGLSHADIIEISVTPTLFMTPPA